MKRTSELTILLVLLAMAACGGSSAADKGRPEDKSGLGRIAAENAASDQNVASAAKASAGDLLRINEVRLSAETLYANTDLKADVDVAPPVPDGVEFEFRWYVGNQQVADVKGDTLPGDSFRKKQWIICEARALAGDKVSTWLKSNWVRVADSPPRIEPLPPGTFNVPGRFSYQITASDIDNDELTYELLAPLDLGVELDKKTGLLTWKLDQALVERLGDSIEISFSVSDSDVPPATGSITLRFQKNTTTQSVQ
jgi:hypothetical protein